MQLEEAKKQYHKVLELQPATSYMHASLGFIYILQAKYDSAVSEIQREPDDIWRLSYLPIVSYAKGDISESDKELEEFIANYHENWGYQIAQNYAFRGDADKTFYWLEQAYNLHDSGLSELFGDPFFNKIKTDPRFTAFMKKMKLM
jgi:tetratricopeptide (TPR) repeat protein